MSPLVCQHFKKEVQSVLQQKKISFLEDEMTNAHFFVVLYNKGALRIDITALSNYLSDLMGQLRDFRLNFFYEFILFLFFPSLSSLSIICGFNFRLL